MTQQPFFLKYLKKTYLKDSNASLIHRQGLYFGNNPELTDEEMDKMIKIFSN